MVGQFDKTNAYRNMCERNTFSLGLGMWEVKAGRTVGGEEHSGKIDCLMNLLLSTYNNWRSCIAKQKTTI